MENTEMLLLSSSVTRSEIVYIPFPICVGLPCRQAEIHL